MDNVIKKYIDKLTINDINRFAVSNNIYLNSNELDIIYKYIKNNWKAIIYSNYNSVLNDLKSKIDINKYNKIEQLFHKFKSKYQNLL